MMRETGAGFQRAAGGDSSPVARVPPKRICLFLLVWPQLSSLTPFPSQRCPHLRPRVPSKDPGPIHSEETHPSGALFFFFFFLQPHQGRCFTQNNPKPHLRVELRAWVIIKSTFLPFHFNLWQCLRPPGKKVIFYQRVFVAAFPNGMIKNNNSDNSVPSTKQ